MPKARTEGVLSDVRDDLQQLGSHLQGAAQDQLQQLGGKAVEYYEKGRDRAIDAEKRFEKAIKKRPVLAICIAAGIGALIGLQLFRRK